MTCSFIRCVLVAFLVASLLLYSLTYAQYYTSNQFSIQSVNVIATSPLKTGPVVVQISVLHNDTSTILENVKFLLLIDEGQVLTPAYHFNYVYPLQVITLRFVINTTTNRDHVLTLIAKWNRAYHAVPIAGTNMYRLGMVVRDIPDKQTLNTLIYVPGKPVLTIKSSSDIIIPGAESRVRLYLCNNGSGTAYDILASFSLQTIPGTSVRVLNSSELAVPYIRPGECIEIPLIVSAYSLTGEVLSSVTFMFTLRYFDKLGNLYESTSKVNVPILSSGLLKVTPLRTYVEAGGTTMVRLRVCNLLPVKVHDLTLNILSTSGIIVNTTRILVPVLRPGSCRDITLTASVPRGLVTKSCTLTYMLSYRIGGDIQVVKQGVLTFSILPLPRVDVVDIVVAPEVARVGELVSISVRIINTGDSSAYNVNVSLTRCRGLRPVTESYEFFGKLNPQEETIASFTVNATEPGKGKCEILLSYFDPLGGHHVKYRMLIIPILRQNVTLSMSSPGFPSSMRPLAVIAAVVSIVVVSIIVIVVVVKRRRRV